MGSSFARAASLLVGGMVIGLLIGLAVSPARHSTSSVTQSGSVSSAGLTTNPRMRSVSRLDSETEHPNILLGNIVTVPFQELYGVLSNLSPQQLNELAVQLKNLPDGKETNAKVAAAAMVRSVLRRRRRTVLHCIFFAAACTAARSWARRIKAAGYAKAQ